MKKLGRNDLCHCGSGKKYKKCCLEKDQHRERHTVRGKVVQFPGSRPASTMKPEAERLWQMLNDKLEWLDWSSEEHRELAESVFPQICRDYKLQDEDSLFKVFSLLLIWNNFSKEVNPSYRKPGGYAAALEHLATSLLELPITKSELAKKHEVSPATLNRYSNQISEFMDGVATPEGVPVGQGNEGSGN